MLRFVTARHNLLTLSTAVLLSATVVTDIVDSSEAIRTVLLGAGSACVMLSLAAVASCLVVNPRLRRQPWAVVLGLLILLCIRFGRASANLLPQAEGTRTLVVMLAGCVTAPCCCVADGEATARAEQARAAVRLDGRGAQAPIGALEGKQGAECASTPSHEAQTTDRASIGHRSGSGGLFCCCGGKTDAGGGPLYFLYFLVRSRSPTSMIFRQPLTAEWCRVCLNSSQGGQGGDIGCECFSSHTAIHPPPHLPEPAHTADY